MALQFVLHGCMNSQLPATGRVYVPTAKSGIVKGNIIEMKSQMKSDNMQHRALHRNS